MKKLILYNHLGVKEQELDVFVEGSDFTYEYITPTCVWLGKIMLVDKEPEPEPETETKLEVTPEPEAKKEEVAEVELETVGDKGTGDTGTSEAKQPESPKRPVKKRAGGKAVKGSKRV